MGSKGVEEGNSLLFWAIFKGWYHLFSTLVELQNERLDLQSYSKANQRKVTCLFPRIDAGRLPPSLMPLLPRSERHQAWQP